MQETSISTSPVEFALMKATAKACHLDSWMCLAIFNTEGVHAVTDHYALNYHYVTPPPPLPAHHAAVALIRGGAYLQLTPTFHLQPTFGR